MTNPFESAASTAVLDNPFAASAPADESNPFAETTPKRLRKVDALDKLMIIVPIKIVPGEHGPRWETDTIVVNQDGSVEEYFGNRWNIGATEEKANPIARDISTAARSGKPLLGVLTLVPVGETRKAGVTVEQLRQNPRIVSWLADLAAGDGTTNPGGGLKVSWVIRTNVTRDQLNQGIAAYRKYQAAKSVFAPAA